MSGVLGRPCVRTGWQFLLKDVGKLEIPTTGQDICHAQWVGMLGNCPEPPKFKHTIAFFLRGHRESFDECEVVLESTECIDHLTERPADRSMANLPGQSTNPHQVFPSLVLTVNGANVCFVSNMWIKTKH